MAELYLFDTGITQRISNDPELNEIHRGLTSSFVYAQDNVNGYPSYETVVADRVYKDSYPQKIEATESIGAGQLLNIYYAGKPLARLATASDRDRFCNSIALTTASIGQLVTCAVKVGVLPHTGAGTMWLSTASGAMTQAPTMQYEIIQKVGEAINGIFYFHFHTPALTNPANYPHLSRSN